MRVRWVVLVAGALLLLAAFVLLPLPDTCDEPGSLVLCNVRSSAAGLTFPRSAIWPYVLVGAVLLSIVVAGAALIVRGGERRARRGPASRTAE